MPTKTNSEPNGISNLYFFFSLQIGTNTYTRAKAKRGERSHRECTHEFIGFLGFFHCFVFIINIFYFFSLCFFPLLPLRCVALRWLPLLLLLTSSSSNSHRFLAANIKHKLGWNRVCRRAFTLIVVGCRLCCFVRLHEFHPKSKSTIEKDKFKHTLTRTKPNGHREARGERKK